MIELKRYLILDKVCKVKIINVRLVKGDHPYIELILLNASNGYIKVRVFLADRWLLGRLVAIKGNLETIEVEKEFDTEVEYEFDENELLGEVVYAFLELNQQDYIVLTDIVNEKEYFAERMLG